MIVVEILALAAAIFVAAHLLLRPRPSAQPFTISHRGAKGLAPENTLMAVREAVRQQAAYTEIDIRRAADGALVVMHDTSLLRTTGRAAAVEELTSAEIVRLVVKTEPGVTPPAEDNVPLFDTILEFIAANPEPITAGIDEPGASPIRLVVEVKDPARYPGIAEQIVEALRRTGTMDKVVVGSFDHAWLAVFQPVAPGVPLAPIADWWTAVPASPPVRMVDYDWRRVVLDPMFVRRMRAQGRQVLVWTVDSSFVMRLMLWLGVDGITTNRPDLGYQVLSD